MRDIRVEDEFARFADEAATMFRPLPVEALPARTRRRTPRVWLAGIAVAILATAGGVALRTAGPGGFELIERPVVLAGATGPHQVRFADAQHGWALFPGCAGEGYCSPRLGRTADGGRTWQPGTLPDLRFDRTSAWQLFALGGRNVALLCPGVEPQYWMSGDAGDTWTRDDSELNGDLTVRSPGTDRFSTTGDRLVVEGAGDVGVVPVRAGMSVRDVVRTPSGSLWALLGGAAAAGPTLLVFSADGTTWQDARASPTRTLLMPSPDRDDIWYVTHDGGRRLELLPSTPDGGGSSRPAPLGEADADGSLVAAGGGRLLGVSPRMGLYVWSPGGTTRLPVPMSGAPVLTRLPDGKVLMHYPHDLDHPVAVGTTDGPWVLYT